MKSIVKGIAKLLKEEELTEQDLLGFLVEEVGEVAVAVNVGRGVKKRKLSEPTSSECADVILNALAIMIHNHYDHEDIERALQTKLAKWQKK